MTRLYNRLEQRERRRKLRNNATPDESVLWTHLRKRKLDGLRFVRQFGIGPFIVDFYCPEKCLSIELDGAGHFTPEGRRKDLRRTAYLESVGIHELRFENQELARDIPLALEVIRKFAHALPSWPRSVRSITRRSSRPGNTPKPPL
jgi:very-short-patch-repair endonuclease